jgi:hypothetical protein
MLKKWPIGEIITIAAIVIVILLTLRLASDNKKLSEDNGRLSEQIKDIGQKNEGLANSIDGLVEQIGVESCKTSATVGSIAVSLIHLHVSPPEFGDLFKIGINVVVE